MTDVKIRAGNYISLQKLLITVNSFNAATTAAEIETNLERTESTWKKIEEAHERILAITDEGKEKWLHFSFMVYSCFSVKVTLAFRSKNAC